MSDRTPIASIGAGIFALGAVFFCFQYYTQSNTNKVEATITSREEVIETDTTGAVSSWYRGSVWFVADNGDTIRGTMRIDPSKGQDVGRQISVAYKRDNPQNFRPAMPFYLYFVFGAVAAAGVVVIYWSFTSVEKKNWR